MKWFVLAVMMLAAAGCKPAREAADEAVEDVLLQRSNLEAGRAAQQKVNAINAVRRESFQEMEE